MNKQVLYSMLALAAGFAAGVTTGYFLTKNKFQKEKNEEAAELRTYYEKRSKSIPEESPSQRTAAENALGKPFDIIANNKMDYELETATLPYRPSNLFISENKYTKEKEETKNMMTKPYVISTEEFMDSELETVTLLYWNDNVLTDDEYELVDDIENIIGESLEAFDPDADSLYVRNPMMNLDYEILRDMRDYSDVINLEKE